MLPALGDDCNCDFSRFYIFTEFNSSNVIFSKSLESVAFPNDKLFNFYNYFC
jgi:hypothetical protein